MNIPFSPPYIDDDVVAEVTSSLRSGWITSGPKVKELEELCAEFCGTKKAVCVNSWTSGTMLILKWLGIGEGDEVIIPAYTFAATALAVLHVGAKPVMVDVLPDFTIDPEKIKEAITPFTKIILSVDIGGWPCDYDAIKEVINSNEVKNKFNPANEIQKQFGRPILIADCAHSLGAIYAGKPIAQAPDIAVFSLHAVKNITTAEGGVITLGLPEPFDNEEIYHWMKLNSLNGQTKDAFSKNQIGQWKYDIVSLGMKINMPDVCAAIGLSQLRKYKSLLMPERQRIMQHYVDFFSKKEWAIIPSIKDEQRVSSCHLFLLRIKNLSEEQRDKLIQKLAEKGASTNVHFIPLPMLTLFKGMGYKIEDFPRAHKNYINEITLPLYPQLTTEQCAYIEEQIEKAYYELKNDEDF
jgi:dTDP-4-amino-4,6-dideoxygalactose transaminase